jgi:cytochrome P450 family 9
MLESLWGWTLVTGLISLITYWLSTWTHGYFAKTNVPHTKPLPFLGNMVKIALRIQSVPENIAEIYNTFKGHSFYGVYEFLNPMIVLRDPELIKRVTVKDFEHFLDRRNIFSEENEPFFGKSLFSLNGELFIASRLLLLLLLCPERCRTVALSNRL